MRQQGAPSCPVLGVEPWFWDAVRIGGLIERGNLSPDSMAASAWEIGEVAWHELEQARAAVAAMRAKRDKWRAAQQDKNG